MIANVPLHRHAAHEGVAELGRVRGATVLVPVPLRAAPAKVAPGTLVPTVVVAMILEIVLVFPADGAPPGKHDKILEPHVVVQADSVDVAEENDLLRQRMSPSVFPLHRIGSMGVEPTKQAQKLARFLVLGPIRSLADRIAVAGAVTARAAEQAITSIAVVGGRRGRYGTAMQTRYARVRRFNGLRNHKSFHASILLSVLYY